MYAFAALLAVVAVVVALGSPHHAAAALALLAAASAAGLRALGFLDPRVFRGALVRRRRNRELRDGLAVVAERLRTAADPAALWESLRQAGPVLGAEHVALRAAAGDARRPVFSFELADGPDDWMRARYPVGPARRSAAVLELGWKGRRRPIDRDTEIAVERLCAQLAKALARVDAAEPLGGAAAGLRSTGTYAGS
jgi:hypothetical protein